MLKRIIKNFFLFFFKFYPSYNKELNLTHVGTLYGGYDIFDKYLDKPNIISCGLGEDASFDIDMINKYNSKIISVDPTPRAKDHYAEIKKNFGKKNIKNYDESGRLNINSYDLRKVNENNFIFLDKAIWSNNNDQLKLYYPSKKDHVSLSITSSKKDKKYYLTAKTINYISIIKNYNLDHVDVLKLDIEGAELEVLEDVLKIKNLPRQILVEYDISKKLSIKSKFILNNLHNRICQKYRLIDINNKGDFLYILK
jgi:hypothetical protein